MNKINDVWVLQNRMRETTKGQIEDKGKEGKRGTREKKQEKKQAEGCHTDLGRQPLPK